MFTKRMGLLVKTKIDEGKHELNLSVRKAFHA